MKPRLDIQFPLKRQWEYWFGAAYVAREGEYLVNHARTGIVMALRAALPKGGRVGVVAYNCHTVANAMANAGCTPFFVDVTEGLRIDVSSIPVDLDAIVVTNLFGIRNDIAAIRKRLPKAIIIVDNAHGYGLPAEGDFTVYSINQGKFPALGPGGILVVSQKLPTMLQKSIEEQYATLSGYGFVGEVKLFAQMLVKAIAYSPCFYWLVMKMKKSANPDVHETVSMKRMAPGVRRLYQAWLPHADNEITAQRANAKQICNIQSKISNSQYMIGSNAFMAIVRTEDQEELKMEFAKRGVETETHFKHCIEWAREFGYKDGTCPNAESLVKHLLMIPTYCNI
jgi:dTDP-4-amino-4,6-dideoxygalactose transaminase